LRDIQRTVIPHGWILPVTPGTQLITVGGAIANDIHGKNHHRAGSFCDHVIELRMQRTNGQVIECGPNRNEDWFAATVGGVGLTGLILSAELQLKPTSSAWLDTETIPYEGLEEFFELANSSEALWEHTVSWIDCMSIKNRGIFMRANHAKKDAGSTISSRKLTIPIVPPVSLINRLSLSPLNAAYYHLQKWRSKSSTAHYESFFYPLDNIAQWNKMYGPKGFYQYQSVVPKEVGLEATSEMLKAILKSGEGSFLAVLKTFGNRSSKGMLGFPKAGVTLALDFPNMGNSTHKLFENLDAIVQEANGRIYLAKDARMTKELFEFGYPRLQEFLAFRDPGITSELSRRLIGS
jgi:FAD/FMN-containing dehydrogenase